MGCVDEEGEGKCMKAIYPVILTPHREDGEDLILVDVPDFGIVTEGTDRENALEMAKDAIGIMGIQMEDDGKELPRPRKMEEIDVKQGAYADVGKGYVTTVLVDFVEYRRGLDDAPVERCVMLPDWMALRAEQAHINLSRVLQDALAEKLGLRDPEKRKTGEDGDT